MRSAIFAIVGVLGALAACQSSDVSRAVGARCSVNSECDQRCLVPGTSYPGGFCTTACATRDDCPTGATCADREGGICLFECAVETDCQFLGAGWHCKSVDLRGGGIKVMACAGT
jgi:hypothetical protein